MNKLGLYIVGFISVFLFSCQNKSIGDNTNDKRENALLMNEIVVMSHNPIVNDDLEDWTKGVDTVFFNELIPNILESDIQLYSSWLYSNKPSFDSISRTDFSEDVKNQNLESLLFHETWFFDDSKFNFEKKIISWSPLFSQINADNEKIKKLYFLIKNNETNVSQKVAEDIIYETNFVNEAKSEYLNLEKFAHLLLDSALQGNTTIYDLYTGEPISSELAMKNMGYSLNTLEFENIETGEFENHVVEVLADFESVRSFIFKEDWFFNSETMSILKKVKAICPVRIVSDIDVDSIEYEKRIPIGFIKMN